LSVLRIVLPTGLRQPLEPLVLDLPSPTEEAQVVLDPAWNSVDPVLVSREGELAQRISEVTEQGVTSQVGVGQLVVWGPTQGLAVEAHLGLFQSGELVALSQDGRALSVHPASLRSSFSAAGLGGAFAGPIQAIDFNFDGWDDIIGHGDRVDGLDAQSLFLGRRTSPFDAAPVPLPARANQTYSWAAEVTGDYFPDLLVATDTPQLLCFRQRRGVFDPAVTTEVSAPIVRLESTNRGSDLGDSLLVLDQAGGLTGLRFDSLCRVVDREEIDTGASGFSVVDAPNPDSVLVVSWSANEIRVFSQTADSETGTSRFDLTETVSPGLDVQSVQGTPLETPDSIDLIVSDGTRLWVYRTASQQLEQLMTPEGSLGVAADLSGDGLAELVVMPNDGPVQLVSSDLTIFETLPDWTRTSTGWISGDWNDDGAPDLAGAIPELGAVVFWGGNRPQGATGSPALPFSH
ncbi:MAG: hypothetical protein KC561_10545, partial [Myxococcales bacterium]|nr:hypothetical protein [Myxococcales bacterium]